MRIYDYRAHVKEEGQEQENLPLRFQKSLEAAMKSRRHHPERRERFEHELIPLMQELARQQNGILYLDIQEERACALVLLEGMLILGCHDIELINKLLPYEIMICARDNALSVEVWVEFWNII